MSNQNSQKYIDVHQHIISDIFRKLLNSVGINGGTGEELSPWDVESTLAMMEKNRIRSSILSYAISGIDIKDMTFFRKLCRESNEYLAKLVSDYPERFGGFAFIPLPDVDGALEEIAYAMDILKLDGVGMHSNMGGIYPGDSRFDPVFEELNKRNAVVHLHPTDIPENHDKRPAWPPYIVEFMFETTRVAANLIYRGTLERYPDVSIILSHAGATLPYLSWRLWSGEFTIPDLQKTAPAGVYEYLKRFYYDTAMAANAPVFSALSEIVPPSRIQFGTDYPYMPEMTIPFFQEEIQNFQRFDSKIHSEIAEGNALRLFPRLRQNK